MHAAEIHSVSQHNGYLNVFGFLTKPFIIIKEGDENVSSGNEFIQENALTQQHSPPTRRLANPLPEPETPCIDRERRTVVPIAENNEFWFVINLGVSHIVHDQTLVPIALINNMFQFLSIQQSLLKERRNMINHE